MEVMEIISINTHTSESVASMIILSPKCSILNNLNKYSNINHQ